MKKLVITLILFAFCAAPLMAAERAKRKKDETWVCIVSGLNEGIKRHHRWDKTGPLLRNLIEKEKRLVVRVIEDPEVLGTDLIDDYDVVFLHFTNKIPLSRDAKVRENLVRYVKNGGGLVLYHFASGAFQEWPGFVELAGRVWNPKMRPHDPYGPFMVNIVDKKHPITAGLPDFEIRDELYTCLDGTPEIHLLATAKSKVDGKDYPMVFVRNVGKGRSVHIALGHNEEALDAEGFDKLLQRSVLWAAGKKP